MARNQSTPQTVDDVDRYKDAIQRRIKYRLEDDEETPLGGLNPYHDYYGKSGVEIFRLILNHLRVTKSDRVLEIGCGTGRIAAPFIKHLGNNYHGFDNNNYFVDYCRTLGPNFQHVDILHEDWNPGGKIDASQVRLPYNDRQFTVVFSFAVFNHLRLNWVQHYLEEISRVLVRGGRIFITLVLATEPKERRESPPFQFSHRDQFEWYDYKNHPLYNIAFQEKEIRRSCISNGLMITEPIRYGAWNKSPLAINGHDVIIAHKRK